MTVPILEGRDLRVVYGRQEVLNVPQVEVREGEVLAIIGPNGAGQSTLLRVLGLLEATTAGTVLYRGQPTSRSGRQGLSIRPLFRMPYQRNQLRAARGAFVRAGRPGKSIGCLRMSASVCG